jgi:DNA polymerase-3 subunit epsilon
MGRCLSPCLLDLDPNLYRRRLDEALGVFEGGADDAGVRLLDHIEVQMREAAAAERFERAAALKRRHGRLAAVLARLGGVLQATHACSRLVLAPHPVKERFDAFWLVAGRVADWGPLPAKEELAERTRAASGSRLARRSKTAVPAEEVDEVRIVGSWLAAHEPPWLALEEAADPERLAAFLHSTAGASLPSVHSLKHSSPLQALSTG